MSPNTEVTLTYLLIISCLDNITFKNAIQSWHVVALLWIPAEERIRLPEVAINHCLGRKKCYTHKYMKKQRKKLKKTLRIKCTPLDPVRN